MPDNSYRSCCIIKNVTGYPCPSCGSTRAAGLLLRGKFAQAIQMNPLAIFTIPAGFLVLMILLYDIVLNKRLAEKALKAIDLFFRKRKWMLWFFFFLVLLNWMWNLYKF